MSAEGWVACCGRWHGTSKRSVLLWSCHQLVKSGHQSISKAWLHNELKKIGLGLGFSDMFDDRTG